MGKPRMIILVRHAQSEGNKNRDIHQYVPDHRVRLTPDGHAQAMEAGRRLRSMLRPDDTVRFYTSPYRRTRETTENIMETLTGDHPELGTSPFQRDKINVYEEPRLREQDFGNFQPCSAEMERMWQERADYGHFFYRIPNGESAADAYDRVSGFNESLWRSFNDNDFPSVCVLVTHGLMTRVFLMKWYHWTVEHFEDLRNINHCEFIVMEQNPDTQKYVLRNELRTWSELKSRAAAANGGKPVLDSPSYVPKQQWGGCANGCDHGKLPISQRIKRISTKDILQDNHHMGPNEKEDHPHASQLEKEDSVKHRHLPDKAKKLVSSKSQSTSQEKMTKANHVVGRTEDVASASYEDIHASKLDRRSRSRTTEGPAQNEELDRLSSSDEFSDELEMLPVIKDKKGGYHQIFTPQQYGRDAGGSRSGNGTPQDGSDDSDFFDTNAHQLNRRMSTQVTRSGSMRSILSRNKLHNGSEQPKRRVSYADEEGIGPNRARSGRHGNAVNADLAEEPPEGTGVSDVKVVDALGDLRASGEEAALESSNNRTIEEAVEQMKEEDRKTFSEVY